jgi:uncharacterized membrane protein YphA (DoxX/SURF4 family)
MYSDAGQLDQSIVPELAVQLGLLRWYDSLSPNRCMPPPNPFMLPPAAFLAVLLLAGAGAAVILARRLEQIRPARLARGFLLAAAASTSLRVVAYFAANVFGVQAVRPASTGPYDLTNLLIGGLLGLAAVHAKRRRFGSFLSEPELLLALRFATGVAFILAGLGNVFFMERTGIDFFVNIGYTHTFHRFIMTTEILGGASLLLPWRWLTLVAVAGLTIDMSGALLNHIRSHDSLNVASAAIVMVVRLLPLALLTVKGRWLPIAAGALACVGVAVAGDAFLRPSRIAGRRTNAALHGGPSQPNRNFALYRNRAARTSNQTR